MTESHADCPTPDAIQAIAAGHTPPPEISAHVARCTRCADAIALERFTRRFTSVMTDDPAPRPQATPELYGYRILHEIARGGQGVVYRAVQDTTDRLVAVKILSAPAAALPRQARDRFAREIRAVAALDHPGVVRLYDSVKLADGRDALIMELVEGRPLNEWANESPTPDTPTILKTLADVADAVHHAHQRGVIHRDLKPSNILIDHDQRPRLLDFGVAARTERNDPRITRAGEFTGTLAYAAPEQIAHADGPPDVRTDIYALGVIGYELLAGQPPYDVNGPLEAAVNAILERNPAPPTNDARPATPRDAWTVLNKAMAKQPDRRYQSAADMARDLRRAARGDAIDARADSRWYVIRKSARRHRIALTFLALTTVALTGVLATLAVGNARLAHALRDSRLMQIQAHIQADAREQAERLLRDELIAIDPQRDPAAMLVNGSTRERELLWCFVDLQSDAPCLDAAAGVAATTPCLWPLDDGDFLLLTAQRTLRRIRIHDDRITLDEPSPVDLHDAMMLGATPSGQCIIAIHADELITLDPADGHVIARRTLGDDLPSPELMVAIAEWGVAISTPRQPLTIHTLPHLDPLHEESNLPAPQTPWLAPDREEAAVIDADGALRVFDVRTGVRLAPFNVRVFPSDRIQRFPKCMLSPDRTRLVVAHGGGLVMRNLNDNVAGGLAPKPGYRVSAAHDPTWSFITATATGDPTLNLWDAHDWTRQPGLPGHHVAVISHAFTPRGDRILTTDVAGDLRLWAAPDRSWRRRLGDPTPFAHQIALDTQRDVILAPGPQGDIPGAPDFVATRIAISHDGARQAATELRGRLRITHHDNPASIDLQLPDDELVAGLRFNPADARQLALCLADARVHIINAETATIERSITIPTNALASDLDWAPDGARIAVSLRDGTVAILDPRGNEPPDLIDAGAGHLRSLTFTHNDATIAAAGEAGCVCTINLRTRRVTHSPRYSEFSLFCIAIHPHDKIAALGDRAGVVHIIDLESWKELATFNARGAVMALQWTTRGDLAVAALDTPVERWTFAWLADTLRTFRERP